MLPTTPPIEGTIDPNMNTTDIVSYNDGTILSRSFIFEVISSTIDSSRANTLTIHSSGTTTPTTHSYGTTTSTIYKMTADIYPSETNIHKEIQTG